GTDRANAGKWRKGRKPIKSAPRVATLRDPNAVDIRSEDHALRQGCDSGPANECLVPPVTALLARLEPKLECDAAEDKAEQHEDDAQIERTQNHRIRQRNSDQEARAA